MTYLKKKPIRADINNDTMNSDTTLKTIHNSPATRKLTMQVMTQKIIAVKKKKKKDNNNAQRQPIQPSQYRSPKIP